MERTHPTERHFKLTTLNVLRKTVKAEISKVYPLFLHKISNKKKRKAETFP